MTIAAEVEARSMSEFREALDNLILFALNDGEMHGGRKSEQTIEAAKWIRKAYRTSLLSQGRRAP